MVQLVRKHGGHFQNMEESAGAGTHALMLVKGLSVIASGQCLNLQARGKPKFSEEAPSLRENQRPFNRSWSPCMFLPQKEK